MLKPKIIFKELYYQHTFRNLTFQVKKKNLSPFSIIGKGNSEEFLQCQKMMIFLTKFPQKIKVLKMLEENILGRGVPLLVCLYIDILIKLKNLVLQINIRISIIILDYWGFNNWTLVIR